MNNAAAEELGSSSILLHIYIHNTKRNFILSVQPLPCESESLSYGFNSSAIEAFDVNHRHASLITCWRNRICLKQQFKHNEFYEENSFDLNQRLPLT